tara:strand:- start:340 stop:486 length:147 start_codon:yes stop_codon:yes gene_type:complete
MGWLKWVRFLKEKDGSWSYLSLLTDAWYNNKYWIPEGNWPYGMKKKVK